MKMAVARIIQFFFTGSGASREHLEQPKRNQVLEFLSGLKLELDEQVVWIQISMERKKKKETLK